MAKDTIGIGVSNVARLMDAGWIGVNNVAREIEEVWIGDANSKAQLAWKAGVDCLFKGMLTQTLVTSNSGTEYAYQYMYANVKERTESAVSKTTTLDESMIYDVQAGYEEDTENLAFHMSCSANGEYFCVSRWLYDTQEYIYKRSTDGTITNLPLDITASTIGVYYENDGNSDSTSTYVYGSDGEGVVGAFNEDGSIFVKPITIKKTSSDSQQKVLLVYKNTDGTGFVFEKYIELPSVHTSNKAMMFSASQDLSVLAFAYADGSEQETFILKGSPDSGYAKIHYEYNSGTTYYYYCGCAQVTPDGQYVLLGYPNHQTGTGSTSKRILHARLFYINGNTATAIKTCYGKQYQGIYLKKAPESDILYLSRQGAQNSGTNSLDSDYEEGIHVYKVSGATITLLGVFGSLSLCGTHVLYDATNDGNYVLCCTDAITIKYCTASRDSTGLITAVSALATVGVAKGSRYSAVYAPITTRFIDYES